jgi:prepilin-type N-terminal cleavage/methylation domain-containing protein
MLPKLNIRGFTLIELLVAVSVLAIVATIGIGSYTQAQKLGRDAKRKQDLRSIAAALEIYKYKNGRYPCNEFWASNSGTPITDYLRTELSNSICDNSKPALKQLIEIYEQTGCSTIALEEINPEDSINYGMVKPVEFNGHFGEIVSFVEKPKPADSPSNLGIIGKYVVTPEILDALEDAESSHGGEIRLIDGFIKLRATQKIYGCKVEGKRFDTGDKAGLITANIHFGLKHPAIAEGIKEYLKTLVD